MSKHRRLGLGSLLALIPLSSPTGVAEPPADPQITYLANGDLMVMDADGTNQRVVLAGSRNVRRGAHDFASPDWSPAGDRIVFGATVDGQRGLYVINVDGSGLRLLVRRNSPQTPAPAWSPALPGGTTAIAYHDLAVGETLTDIFLVDPDTPTPVPLRLTNTPALAETSVTWSPSGTKLAVVVGAPGVWALYDFAAGTYDLQQHAGPLASAHLVYQPAWSKTDETLVAWSVASAVGELSDIWIVDLDNPASPWKLTATAAAGERRPTWSPDDSRIIYMANHPGPGKKSVHGIEVIEVNTMLVTWVSGGGFASWRR